MLYIIDNVQGFNLRILFKQTISEEVFFPDEEPAKVEESFCGTPK